MSQRRLRVLVVDDATLFRRMLVDLLGSLPGVEVVGSAANGRIALEQCAALQPDLLTLDLEMPELDGLGVLRGLRAQGLRCGAIMLSALTQAGAEATVAALRAGAFDFVLKPSGGTLVQNRAQLKEELSARIEVFARRRLGLRPGGAVPSAPRPAVAWATASRPAMARPAVVAIGVSTGGPDALARLVPGLPADLAVPVLVAQHMPPMFTASLATSLGRKCPLTVREAVDGEPVEPGTILIAPGGRQMRVERSGARGRIRVTDDPAEHSVRPGVDYLLRSVAQCYGSGALAVILTGMGHDGLAGCRQVKAAGGAIITQDEATCVVYGMPRGPAEEGLSDLVAPLEQIAGAIVRAVGRRAPVMA